MRLAGSGPRHEVGCGLIWANGPARLRASNGRATAFLGANVEKDADCTGPCLHLGPGSLEALCGPFPQYPLYYHRRGSTLLVCSSMASLRAVLGGADLDLERLATLLAAVPDPDPGRTAFRGLRRIRAGESLRADGNGVTAVRAGNALGGSFFRGAPQELAVELRAQLGAAVERATSGARRVAVLVSGGLDSSGLLGLLLEQRGATRGDITALTQTWVSPGDDGPYLAALERELGIRALRVTGRDAAPWFVPSLAIDDQPQLFCHACGDLLLWSTAHRLKVDVTIGGYGGDQVLDGHISFAPLLRRGHPIEAARRALRLRVPWEMSPARRLYAWMVAPLARPLVAHVAPGVLTQLRGRRLRQPWMTRRWRDLLEPSLRDPSFDEISTPDEHLRAICERPGSGEQCVSWGQVASATGTAPVDVFRDPDLVRFIARIDPLMLSHGDMHRGLYRQAIQGLVPETIRLRRNKALGQPATCEAATRANARPHLEGLASLDRLASLGLVEPTPFRRIFEPWLASLMRGERSHRDPMDEKWLLVWPLLATEAFLRGVDKQRGGGG